MENMAAFSYSPKPGPRETLDGAIRAHTGLLLVDLGVLESQSGFVSALQSHGSLGVSPSGLTLVCGQPQQVDAVCSHSFPS